MKVERRKGGEGFRLLIRAAPFKDGRCFFASQLGGSWLERH